MESEWNTDSFQIDVVTLHKRCVATAGRLRIEATTLGEECDITSERLVNLYVAQRGRCAILGAPLMAGAGRGSVLDDPWAMELDHINPVYHSKSRRIGKHCGGAVALIGNVRWVSRIGHSYRHFSEKKGVSLGEVASMICRVHEHGSPWNDSVDVMEMAGGADSREQKIEEIFNQSLSGGEFFPGTKRLTEKALSSGVYASENDFVALFRRLGIDPRKLEAENRSQALRRFLSDRADLLEGLVSGTHAATFVHAAFSEYLKSLGIKATSAHAFRRYELSTVLTEIGANVPVVRRSVKDACSWRTRIREVMKEIGSCGASALSITDALSRGGMVPGVFVDDVHKVLDSMVARRMADRRDDGGYVARMTVHEAAVMCGLTVNTMRKYHKHGRGPVAEIGQTGKGVVCLTYSMESISTWKEMAVLSDSVRAKTVSRWNSTAEIQLNHV